MLLGRYFSSLRNADGKARFGEAECFDLDESERSQWLDDADLWPSITQIHLAMYFLHTILKYTAFGPRRTYSLYNIFGPPDYR